MSILKDFKKFILRGNVVDLAVGVVIGAGFGSFINAIVKDLLTPFIGAIAKVPDFSNLTFTLRGSQFAYGDFLNIAIGFFLTACAVYFLIVLPINTLVARSKSHAPVDPTNKKCPECLSDIPLHAKRCAFCTSEQPAEGDVTRGGKPA